ncbi:MAG: DNA polymerase IV [Ignavibacteria bacterium]|jgi:DNA polymerase-4|nr:DNA polymerase IV [Ignavibacteria bacterium]
MRTIFHLDLDTFFVSVERILNPSLNGKAVIVGANPQGRGVVAACSYEARKFGLHSAMPIRQAFQLCPNGIYLRGHFEEYERYSKEVKNLLKKYSPEVEQASIDEFYLDFTGCKRMYGDFQSLGKFLQNQILTQLFLPSSIGIATNKSIAKIASDYNKPFGITFVSEGEEKKFLESLPVEKMPGIGKVMKAELNSKGIITLGDLAALPIDFISILYGKVGIDLWNRANGSGSEYLSLSHKQKNISKEKTFHEDVIDTTIIKKMLFDLTSKVCQSLRDEGLHTATISIKLRYTDFITTTRAKTIKPTDDDRIIYQTASELFHKSFTRRVAVRLIGIHVSKFVNASQQEFLFHTLESKRKQMLEAVNIIRSKYGYNSILIGDVGKSD